MTKDCYCTYVPVPIFMGCCKSCRGYVEICEECGLCFYCSVKRDIKCFEETNNYDMLSIAKSCLDILQKENTH